MKELGVENFEILYKNRNLYEIKRALSRDLEIQRFIKI